MLDYVSALAAYNMATQGNSFDSFLKHVIAKDSHPIYYSFLPRSRIFKILLVDSLLTGSIFGLYSIITQAEPKSIFSSWKFLIGWFSTLVSISFLKSLRY